MQALDKIKARRCPCCDNKLKKLGADLITQISGERNFEGAILRAVLRGRGHPVPTERIFDEMWADDPDGGPSRSAMHINFQSSRKRLNLRLEGSGAAVASVGYCRGYRLDLCGASGAIPIDELLAAVAAARERQRALERTIAELEAGLAARRKRKPPAGAKRQLSLGV